MLDLMRHRLHRLSWIAFVAVFALAFLPTVSRAMAGAAGNAAWAEVCTPQGTKLVAVDGSASDTPVPQVGAGHLDHCPLCGLGGDLAGPAAVPCKAIEAHLRDAVPPLFLRAPHTLFAWAAAQPRGPPLSF